MDSEIIEQRVQSSKICYFEIRIRHRVAAVEVWMKAHPAIEEFFKTLSGEGTDSIDAYGRFWSSPDVESPVRVYKQYRDIDCYDRPYAIDNIGGSFDESREGNARTNISFLRLVGISSPDGVRFIINTPIHLPAIRTLESRLCNAVRNFATDFIVPVSVVLKLVGNEEKP